MKLLYHGTNLIIEEPKLSFSRVDIDFGIGFYLSEDITLEKDWADKRVKRDSGLRIINVYSSPEDLIFNPDLIVKVFNGYSEEWFDFVIENRECIYQGPKYDLVVGNMADNFVYDVIDSYLNGDYDYILKQEGISPKQFALNSLKFKRGYSNSAVNNIQFCFKTEKSLKFLSYLYYSNF